MSTDWVQPRTERITTIAQRAFDREQEINPSPFSIAKLKLSLSENDTDKKSAKTAKISDNTPIVKTEKRADSNNKAKANNINNVKSSKAKKAVADVVSAKPTGNALRDEVRVVFKKALTDREQKVFDYFSEHQNEVVYAKDLAVLLDLPRDYVYKYIKNLRAKIEGEKLENADKGGFILHM